MSWIARILRCSLKMNRFSSETTLVNKFHSKMSHNRQEITSRQRSSSRHLSHHKRTQSSVNHKEIKQEQPSASCTACNQQSRPQIQQEEARPTTWPLLITKDQVSNPKTNSMATGMQINRTDFPASNLTIKDTSHKLSQTNHPRRTSTKI